jgi:hypothetical protein
MASYRKWLVAPSFLDLLSILRCPSHPPFKSVRSRAVCNNAGDTKEVVSSFVLAPGRYDLRQWQHASTRSFNHSYHFIMSANGAGPGHTVLLDGLPSRVLTAGNDAKIHNFQPVARIMKMALPENAKIAKEAKECMQECVSEFISFITSEGMPLYCYTRTPVTNVSQRQRSASRKSGRR